MLRREAKRRKLSLGCQSIEHGSSAHAVLKVAPTDRNPAARPTQQAHASVREFRRADPITLVKAQGVYALPARKEKL